MPNFGMKIEVDWEFNEKSNLIEIIVIQSTLPMDKILWELVNPDFGNASICPE